MRKFANMDFSVWGSARDVSVQTVKEVWWVRKVVFPLLAKYNRVNRTIDGSEEPIVGLRIALQRSEHFSSDQNRLPLKER